MSSLAAFMDVQDARQVDAAVEMRCARGPARSPRRRRRAGVRHQPVQALGQAVVVVRLQQEARLALATISGMPPRREMTTGRPQAIASMATSEKQSARVGSTNRSLCWYSRTSSGLLLVTP